MMLLQIATILLFCFVFGKVALYFGQTQVIGYIFAGILLGPSVLLKLLNESNSISVKQYSLSSSFVEELATLSMVLLMFDIGLTLFHSGRPALKKQVISSFSVAVIGMLTPFIFGAIFAIAVHSYIAPETDRSLFVLFMGTAMSASALPVIFKIIEDLGIQHMNIVPTIIYSAVVTDIFGWLIIAILSVSSAVSTSNSNVYLYLITIAAAYISFHLLTILIINPLIRKYLSNKSIIIPVMLCWMLLCAWGSDFLQLHAGLGALLAGALFSTVPGLSQIWSEVTEGTMRYLLLPVLFASAGLKTTFDLSNIYVDLIWIAALTSIGFITKVGGSYLGARLSGMISRDSWFISIMMNTKGLMELVVLSVGLELGLINQHIYSIMVIVTIILTCMTSPIIKLIISKNSNALINSNNV